MDLPCSGSRCLEHRLQFVEEDDHSMQLRAGHDTMIFDDMKRDLA